ncbi:MAG TPA: type I methionyl aminopeptidase [Firmicutes bacterium]|nr:type I methionyl aminopeptidase [Bacillota bacterium]
MIPVKNAAEIVKMREAGKALKEVFGVVAPLIAPGLTTMELNAEIEKKISSLGATAPCKGYMGYPAAACISIDDVVVHGIPSLRRLAEGEIVSVDIVLKLNGYCADATRTYAVGKISEEKQRLIDVTRRCFYNGVAKLRAGARLGDAQSAIQMTAELAGYGVVRAMAGHGIGRSMHEDPSVENYGRPGTGVLLKAGMCLAVEPMITMGTWKVKIDDDGWTCRTTDGSPAAHYENTVLITSDGCEILTE